MHKLIIQYHISIIVLTHYYHTMVPPPSETRSQWTSRTQSRKLIQSSSPTWMLICLSCSILCSSSRLPFSVRNFLASCSASSLFSGWPSSRRFSLCLESSERASTFSSISSSMFCRSNRSEASSNMALPLSSQALTNTYSAVHYP